MLKSRGLPAYYTQTVEVWPSPLYVSKIGEFRSEICCCCTRCRFSQDLDPNVSPPHKLRFVSFVFTKAEAMEGQHAKATPYAKDDRLR